MPALAARTAHPAARRNRYGPAGRRPRSRRRAARSRSGKSLQRRHQRTRTCRSSRGRCGCRSRPCRRAIAGDRAIAVILDLVQPVIALRAARRPASRVAARRKPAVLLLVGRALFFRAALRLLSLRRCGLAAFFARRTSRTLACRWLRSNARPTLPRGDLVHRAAGFHARWSRARSTACRSARS